MFITIAIGSTAVKTIMVYTTLVLMNYALYVTGLNPSPALLLLLPAASAIVTIARVHLVLSGCDEWL